MRKQNVTWTAHASVRAK